MGITVETKFDEIDLQILKSLQEDGRRTNVDLARDAGISAPPCLRRVRALENADVIQGYHADINPAALGFGVAVFAQVGLHSQNDNDLRAFETKVAEWPLVRECYMVAGDADFLLKIVARNWDEYQRFLSTELTTSANIKNIKSKLVVRTSKNLPGVPIEIVQPE
jgi:DNA-binding Lrp family transcriptional regulator